jgi:hypothetical protein
MTVNRNCLQDPRHRLRLAFENACSEVLVALDILATGDPAIRVGTGKRSIPCRFALVCAANTQRTCFPEAQVTMSRHDRLRAMVLAYLTFGSKSWPGLFGPSFGI